MSYFNLEPSVVAASRCVPYDDATTLRSAMEGVGTDEGIIIGVLTKRSNEQRQQILTSYTIQYGKDLVGDLKGELVGNLESVILGLLDTPPVYLAKQLNKAMEGFGTNENVLTEILCTHSSTSVHHIKLSYQELYGKSLDSDLDDELSGEYKNLLRLLLTTSRSEHLIDPNKAVQLAEYLCAVGDKNSQVKKMILKIFSHQSFGEIKLVTEEYKKLTGQVMEKVIRSKFSGDLRCALLTLLKCSENQCEYFAEKLRAAMKGLGTADDTLIRIIVSRCELDLEGIKREYQKLYGRSLYSDVHSETSGDYREALLCLIGIV